MKSLFLFFCYCLAVFSCSAQEKINIYFDFDHYDLNPAALSRINDWIASQKDKNVLNLSGYCDSKGTPLYNDSLALKRIQSVYTFLISKNVAIDTTYVQNIVGENFTQDTRQALNRKVEITYLKPIPAVDSRIVPAVLEVISPTMIQNSLSEQLKTAKKGAIIKLNNINFFNNSARIVPKSFKKLQELLAVLEQNPKLEIEIQGHICCQTSKRMNHISHERAKAIYDFLVEHKIKRNRLKYKGYGVSKPLYPIPEKNEFQQDENRRVEIKILEN
jgi:outer membrane protein OmpA-like peptidoglycan-associated protein